MNMPRVISSGTMKTNDLLGSFADVLEELDTEGEYDKLQAEALAFALLCEYEEYKEKAINVLYEVVDALNAFALPYMYFGTLENDGTCFGFFVDQMEIEDDSYTGDLLTVGDLDDIRIGKHEGYVLFVNDHGNMTLYDGDMTEVWSVV